MLYKYMQFQPRVDRTAFIAPTAVLIGQVSIAEGASVWFNSVLRGDINSIEIGRDSNIQDSCVLHVTDELSVVIEERVTVGHGVIVHGCRVASDCLIGMGSILLDGVKVGRGSLIAAGSLVAPGTVVPENSLVMGVPGKVVRTLNAVERAKMSENWRSYVDYSRAYKDSVVFESV
ncbi:MAG: gamma carbonic anhydrase family protein [Candidatus Obscuribacterales bacterium]|nr:gamma carbonic anhydrase family protein [Candidatus Obscuribacterales bacterium]